MEEKIIHAKAEQERYQRYYKSLFSAGKMIFVGTLLQRAAQKFPERIALLCNNDVITYKELYFKAQQFSKQLKTLGVKSGDRVCLLFRNSIEYYIAYYGAWQLGAVIAPVNTFLVEAELLHIIKDAQPAALIVSEDLYQKVENIKNEITTQVIKEQDFAIFDPLPEVVPHIDIPHQDPDEMAALLYTSGTTGFPKGVMMSSRNILVNVAQAMARIVVNETDRAFGILPLFHSYAQITCVWGAFFLGASVVIVPKIDRHRILDGFKHKPTFMLGIPAFYGLLCLMKTVNIDSVRYFASGGDALPDKIRAAFELIYGRKLCNGFGLTETSPVISVNVDDNLLATDTVGKPLIGMECSLRDEDGNPVAKGEVGILWVKGENVMLGYYNAIQATKAVLQDGWFNTGDFMKFDEDNNLVVMGRFKDLIASKGMKIYPPEVENVLLLHPNVMQVALIGQKDDDAGEIPIAIIVLKEKQARTEDELRELSKQKLASYKVPRKFIFVEELPKTALGKIDKKKLRKDYQ